MIKHWRTSWRRMPRPLKRPMLWFLLPLGVMLLQFALLLWLGTTSRSWGFNPGMTFLFAQTIAVILVARTSGRIRRAFVDSGGRLCTRCAHSLAGLGDHGVCPECGAPFSIESDRVTWGESNLMMDREVRERDQKLTQALRPPLHDAGG